MESDIRYNGIQDLLDVVYLLVEPRITSGRALKKNLDMFRVHNVYVREALLTLEAGAATVTKSMSSQHTGRKRLGNLIMTHRWPKSIHSQVEAVFHSIRSIRETKLNTPLGIRSFGTWKIYRYEAHRFVKFMLLRGHTDILETETVRLDISDYLEERLANYVAKNRSRQTMETILSAIGKFQYAVNHYIELHALGVPKLDSDKCRMQFYIKIRKLLRKSNKVFDNRAYPDPIRIIEAIEDGTCQLQASLQYEGGLRSEGVGAPSHRRLMNPLNKDCLQGLKTDPVTGFLKGIVVSKEKGGKKTEHYVSTETYQRLEDYIEKHGKLECDYRFYLEAIRRAAKATGQNAFPRRGSHGLKFNFAQERYFECVSNGLSHEQALQQTSLETSHIRLRETLTYTRG